MMEKKSNFFFQKVYGIVKRIPRGKVVTYGQIAAFLGNPRSARMVGWAMHGAPYNIPWHRVVMKSGKLPFEGINLDDTNQREMLSKEGIMFRADGTIIMEEYTWDIEI